MIFDFSDFLTYEISPLHVASIFEFFILLFSFGMNHKYNKLKIIGLSGALFTLSLSLFKYNDSMKMAKRRPNITSKVSLLVYKIEWTLWFVISNIRKSNNSTMKIRILFWKYLDMTNWIRFWRVRRIHLPKYTTEYISLSWLIDFCRSWILESYSWSIFMMCKSVRWRYQWGHIFQRECLGSWMNFLKSILPLHDLFRWFSDNEFVKIQSLLVQG